jgi:hypothetical protein
MNPLIPAPDTLSLSWAYFQGLLMLMFPLHLLLMNAMIGCAALSLYSLTKKRETDQRLAHELARILPFLIAFAINFGVAALLFLQVIYGNFFYASSVLMAVFWLSVPLVLLVAYYGAYLYDFRFAALGKSRMPLAALVLAIFLAVAFFFTNNTTLMLEPHRWSAYFRTPGGTILNAGSPSVWPRYLHFVTGALAIGGLFVALYGRFKGRRDPELGARAVELGMNAFTGLTMLQIAVGLWFLISLPRAVMLLFLGGGRAATALFAVGVALALAALAAGFKRRVATSTALAIPLVFVMAFLRDLVRGGYLKPFLALETLKVVPEYSPPLLFIVTLLAGVATIIWMLRKTAMLYGNGV